MIVSYTVILLKFGNLESIEIPKPLGEDVTTMTATAVT